MSRERKSLKSRLDCAAAVYLHESESTFGYIDKLKMNIRVSNSSWLPIVYSHIQCKAIYPWSVGKRYIVGPILNSIRECVANHVVSHNIFPGPVCVRRQLRRLSGWIDGGTCRRLWRFWKYRRRGKSGKKIQGVLSLSKRPGVPLFDVIFLARGWLQIRR